MKFGVVKDYWLETGSKKVDSGRYAVTKKEEDRYVFRVPMPRRSRERRLISTTVRSRRWSARFA